MGRGGSCVRLLVAAEAAALTSLGRGRPEPGIDPDPYLDPYGGCLMCPMRLLDALDERG
jgi:hypothetical protein